MFPDQIRSRKDLQEKFKLTQILKDLKPSLQLAEENTVSKNLNWFRRDLDSGDRGAEPAALSLPITGASHSLSVHSKLLRSSEFLWILLEVLIIKNYAAMVSYLTHIRIVALSGIFSILSYQVLSCIFWIIKKSMWPCLLLEFIIRNIFSLTVYYSIGIWKPATNEISYFHCFPLNQLYFVSQNIHIPCILHFLIYFSNCITCIFSILQAQPELAAGFSQHIWLKANGHPHLTERGILEPHSHVTTPLRLPWNHSSQASLNCFHHSSSRGQPLSVIQHPQALFISCFWGSSLEPVPCATPPDAQTLYLDFQNPCSHYYILVQFQEVFLNLLSIINLQQKTCLTLENTSLWTRWMLIFLPRGWQVLFLSPCLIFIIFPISCHIFCETRCL